jgi:hypothetical protein
MGVKYLTAYADSLVGDPSGVVRDLDRIPPFAAANAAAAAQRSTPRATTSSQPPASCSNLVVLDASGGLARYLKPDDDAERNLFDFQDMWAKVRSDVAAFHSLGYRLVAFLDATVPTAKLPVWKSRRRQEFGKLLKLARCIESSPPTWPKDAFTPPESGLQALADAFAACGCEVHLGLDDVDAEAAAFAKANDAYAVVTCDSDFFVADLGDATVRVWHWEHLGPSWGGLQQRWSASAPSSSSSSAAASLSVREYRVDLLRARLRLGVKDMPLLAACLGNDGVPHITRSQLERVLAEHPAPAAAASSFRGGGYGGRGRGRGGFGGGGGPPPWRVVEVLAHEIARQLQAGLLPNDASAAAALATTDTARFVSTRVLSHHKTVRDAYTSTPHTSPPGSFRPAGTGTAPNVVRAVIARHGMMVKAQRSDDVREPPVTTAVSELRVRVYAGCGIERVRELLYHPISGGGGGVVGARAPPPFVPPPRNNSDDDDQAGPLGETRSLLSALPAIGSSGGTPSFADDESRLVWQEDFVDVNVKAELAALGKPPLLPSSPEVVAASKSGEALAAFAAGELLRLELITPVEAELLKRQANPAERSAIRQQAGAERLKKRGDRWSGPGGVVACMRSVRVATLLITVHTWLAALLDNVGMPSIEQVLDVRVLNELWRREVGRLEKEPQPKGAAQRRRWVGAPTTATAAVGGGRWFDGGDKLASPADVGAS